MVFFFQAEDGIRDHCVTGVQTCALPISSDGKGSQAKEQPAGLDLTLQETLQDRKFLGAQEVKPEARSEERRVGKECRSRWERYDERENTRERTDGMRTSSAQMKKKQTNK